MPNLTKLIAEHIQVFNTLESIQGKIISAANVIKKAIEDSHKILICGNGGSAADSQHFAAELTGHYQKDRPALAAIALTTDTSALTAIGNDYCYEDIFSRQVEALGLADDVLIAISTSGNSKNVLKAIDAAHKKKLRVIMLTGRDGGTMVMSCKDQDLCLIVPHPITSRIQEAHIFILHYFCDVLDAAH